MRRHFRKVVDDARPDAHQRGDVVAHSGDDVLHGFRFGFQARLKDDDAHGTSRVPQQVLDPTPQHRARRLVGDDDHRPRAAQSLEQRRQSFGGVVPNHHPLRRNRVTLPARAAPTVPTQRFDTFERLYHS